jgi:hypothetical protein
MNKSGAGEENGLDGLHSHENLWDFCVPGPPIPLSEARNTKPRPLEELRKGQSNPLPERQFSIFLIAFAARNAGTSDRRHWRALRSPRWHPARIKNHRQGIAGGFGGLAKSRPGLPKGTKPPNHLVDLTRRRYMIFLVK